MINGTYIHHPLMNKWVMEMMMHQKFNALFPTVLVTNKKKIIYVWPFGSSKAKKKKSYTNINGALNIL